MWGIAKHPTLWLTNAALIAASIIATPAMAGRCGGSLAVDAPTTLSKVARECNVSLATLREANPGINPGDVRPGDYVAMPDEGANYLKYVTTPARSQPSGNSTVYYSRGVNANVYRAPKVTDDAGLGKIIPVQDYRGNGVRAAQRIRLRDVKITPDSPDWLQTQPEGGHFSAADRLSYQKLSAERIRNASFQLASADASSTVPLYTEDDAGAPLARYTNDSKITVEKSRSDYDLLAIITAFPGPTPDKPAASLNMFALSGDIVDADQGCLILRSKDDTMWRLASPPPIGQMLGKTVTVWGAYATSDACSGGPAMLVDHAVFAEPWTGN